VSATSQWGVRGDRWGNSVRGGRVGASAEVGPSGFSTDVRRQSFRPRSSSRLLRAVVAEGVAVRGPVRGAPLLAILRSACREVATCARSVGRERQTAAAGIRMKTALGSATSLTRANDIYPTLRRALGETREAIHP